MSISQVKSLNHNSEQNVCQEESKKEQGDTSNLEATSLDGIDTQQCGKEDITSAMKDVHGCHTTDIQEIDVCCDQTNDHEQSFFRVWTGPDQLSSKGSGFCVSDKTSINILSFNIQGATGNKVYLDELVKKYDILCLQEHWLYSFEKKALDNMDQFTSFTRCIDDTVPISPVQRPRGYGGISILIKNTLMSSVTKLEDGNNRIQAIEITTVSPHRPVLIINVYMPSRGIGTPSNIYSPVIEELTELVSKFKDSHELLLCGDFNVFINEYVDAQDDIFRDFCTACNLSRPVDTPEKETFRHARGTSQIDHFLLQGGSVLLSEVRIADVSPCNSSDHVPIHAKLTIDLCPDKETVKQSIPSTKFYKKPRWNKCDLDLYQATLQEKLSNVQYKVHTTGKIQEVISELTHFMHYASENSIPGYNKQAVSKTKRKGWTENVRQAVKQSRKAHWEWVHGGKPAEKGNILVTNRDEARTMVRSAQRQENAKEKEDLYEEINTSSDLTQPLFYSLIQRQRKTNTNCFEAVSTESFNEHFNKLAHPLQNDRFDQAYLERIHTSITARSIASEHFSDPVVPASQDEMKKIVMSLNRKKAPDKHGLTADTYNLQEDCL